MMNFNNIGSPKIEYNKDISKKNGNLRTNIGDLRIIFVLTDSQT